MDIVLAALEHGLAAAWTTLCGTLPGVTVHHGSILDVPCDAVVSPANSFGFMDGGIDAAYLHRFGRGLQHRVQSVIHSRHHGELLVGQADVVPTDDPSIPWLVVAPTMRVPMILGDSVNPYLAARATLLLLAHGRFAHGPCTGEPIGDHIRTVAFPGLGTGVGRVPWSVCARQVAAAISDVLIAPPSFPDSWAEASERHQLLYTDRPRRLQHPEG